MKNPLVFHPEEVAAATDEGSLYLLDSIPRGGTEILRGVYPEQNAEILRCAQNDK